jgi:2-polyprenyl-3-methyl-5-hydroxy-6-metoxy-1,4-benzoquinol methylase
MSLPESVTLESRGCALGCPAGEEPVLVGRDRLHDLPGEFHVARCSTCGLMRTDPRPTADSIGFYYPPDYGPHLGTRVVEPSRRRPAWLRKTASLVRSAANTNSERLPILAPGRMLEIGSASGSFLHRMAAKGWNVAGIELSPDAGGDARRLGFPVHVGRLEQAPPPEHPYDLVVGWMVLEHLHEPVAALRKLREWATRDAWLALSVPNAACYELDLFREKWYALQLPTHLWHFTPATLTKVLERGGWRVERLFYQRDLKNVIASAGYWLEDRNIIPRLARWLKKYPDREGSASLLIYPLSLALALLHQTGRMTVWARRVD